MVLAEQAHLRIVCLELADLCAMLLIACRGAEPSSRSASF